ncbi:hypothetical protein lerEdw1_015689 [Lerista edwardsae]|nr:hypothetical protein lerEdw1_015689 [Lerista edwardsae]
MVASVSLAQVKEEKEDYLNNLCPDSAEYEDTQAALLIVSEVADRANDSMQQGENLQKLVHIEHSVKGQSNLLQPGRVFLKEGTLMKVSGKNRHPRHLFLMNDVLLYTYPQKDGKYRLKNTLAVSGMRVILRARELVDPVSRPMTEKAQNVLKIEYAENCLILSASGCISSRSSCSERDEWYSCISRSIPDDYRTHSAAAFHNSVELRERLGIPLGERPPTLVPVSHVMMCMHCGCDFKLTLRRHHCHACGKIVCRNCSRNKYPLKYLKDRLAKVCDGCYSELKRRERPMSMSFPTSSSRFSGSAFSSVFHNIHYSSFKRQKKIPSALLEVAASGEGSAISGYLSRCKRGKRHWKKLWFVIKGKVLYTYTANETVKFGTLLYIPLAVRGALIRHSIPIVRSCNSEESLPQRIHIRVTRAPSKAHFPFCTDFRTKSPQRACLCWGSQLSQKRKTEIWMQFSIFTTSKLCFIASEQRITIQHRGTGC